jgi:hypothetical protein
MNKLLLVLLLAFVCPAFSQEKKSLVVEWHPGLWKTAIISKRYPDWPQKGIVEVEYDGYNIYYTAPNSFRKQLILRNFNVGDVINNPNLFKPALLGIGPDNDCVKVYWEGSSGSAQSRIRGSMNPYANNLPKQRKY